MKINSLKKGRTGEYEFARYLQELFQLPELPTRNLEQTRSGGYDFLIAPFIFEVKRQQTLNLNSWWWQVSKAAQEWVLSGKLGYSYQRVVAYRQNRKPWNFLISTSNLIPAQDVGYIQLTEPTFRKWATEIYWRENK